MTKLEQKQQEYIDLLTNQVIDLSMMSKIELGNDVIEKLIELKTQIEDLNPSVPFIDEVEEFNKTFGKPVNYEPTIPEEKEWMFVYNFVREELEEYKEACEKGDIVEVLDALCDITYVSLANGALLHGLKNKISPAYAEVQASNMSKACQTEKDAIATSKSEALRIGEETYYEQVEDKWVVYRKSDKKVLKSLKYFKPNLKQFFTDKEIQKSYLKQLTGN
jgi:predicted HAD superfamily Cof-like phosphohydrolase